MLTKRFYFILMFGMLVDIGTTCFGKELGIIAGLLYAFLPLEIFSATMLLLQFDDADVKTLKNAYVIANWERVFFLNRLYGVPIPDFLYHPPPQWKPYARIGGYVNPCLIYEIP